MYRTIIERYMLAETAHEQEWLGTMLEMYPFNEPLVIVLV